MIATRPSSTNRRDMTFILTSNPIIHSHPVSSTSPPPCPPSWIGQIPLPSSRKQRENQVWRNVSHYAPRAREKSVKRDDSYGGLVGLGLKPQSGSLTGRNGSDKSTFDAGCVTVRPVLSPPESSYTSSSSISTSSSSLSSPIENCTFDLASTVRPRGSFWAQYPTRPLLPHSRGRCKPGRQVRKYDTPLPSPYSPSDLDDDEDDEADDALRVKTQKWFLAPPRLERAASGSTIVRQAGGSTDEAVCAVTRRNRPRRTTCRPRFKLFPLEDDVDETTEHQQHNQEILARLWREPESKATSELTDARACGGPKRDASHRMTRGLDAHEWPLRGSNEEDSEFAVLESHAVSSMPLSKHLQGDTVCWRGKHAARYNAMAGYRREDAFHSFKIMTESEPASTTSESDTRGLAAFSVQLSLVSDPSRPVTLGATSSEPCAMPPRRRSDGDLLRKRVLEWNMVLNGKVSNVRQRGDKAPRDPTRRSSCPAKLGPKISTVDESAEEREGTAQGEPYEREEFQNR